MSGRTLAWVEEVLQHEGRLKKSNLFDRDDETWVGAAIDTRADVAGRLFFALKGSRSDGHSYVEDAIAKGCRGVVVEKSEAAQVSTPFYLVDNTLASLQQLAGAHRDGLSVRIVSITGSTGKTTTKEYTRAILKKKYRLHSSPGNFNNHIGVPLTLLDTDHEREYLVSEVAANHIGEIEFLTGLLRPDVGVITNVGDAHIGLFGSRQKIAEAKAELLLGIDRDGVAVLPGDDDYIDLLRDRAVCRVVTFGYGDACTIRVTSVTEGDDRISFQINGQPFEIRSFARYNVLNACAAFAVGELCGIDVDSIREGLAEAEMMPGRAAVYRGSGIVLIDDSYNANPSSMKEAVIALERSPGGRRIVVLGDMAELGDFSESAHRELGVRIGEGKVDMVFWLGAMGPAVGKGLEQTGSGVAFYHYSDLPSLVAAVKGEVAAGDVVLVKASRASHLDRAVDELKQTFITDESEN